MPLSASAPAATDELLESITNKAQTSLPADAMLTPEAGTWNFRVWVVDTHDHVAASNAVTVVRPE